MIFVFVGCHFRNGYTQIQQSIKILNLSANYVANGYKRFFMYILLYANVINHVHLTCMCCKLMLFIVLKKVIFNEYIHSISRRVLQNY